MIVLSCFDGMSCGQIALNRLGIRVDKYYASEIDKYAIKVTQSNYPDTIQLGSITEWREWNIERPDIIIGGSPCQGFSIAGNRLEFDDPRSKLFLDYYEILKKYKPKYFLLENVRMSETCENKISSMLGELYPEVVTQYDLLGKHLLEPIVINSALVSAQNRVRLYWTNIQGIKQPEDKGILLKDILESGEADREKSYCIDANYFKGGNMENYKEKARRQIVNTDGKTPALSSSAWEHNNTLLKGGLTWRKLTPLECERLQTVPDNYTNHVSNSQRYRQLGNGWTVDVICHILKGIKDV